VKATCKLAKLDIMLVAFTSASQIIINVSSKERSGRQATYCPRSKGKLESVSLIIYGMRNLAVA
jgi:hypothetical protein